MFLLSYTFSEYCSNQQSPWGVLRSSQCEHLGVQYHCSRVSQQCYGGVLLLPEHFPSYVHRSQSGKKKTSKFIFWKSGIESQQPPPQHPVHIQILARLFLRSAIRESQWCSCWQHLWRLDGCPTAPGATMVERHIDWNEQRLKDARVFLDILWMLKPFWVLPAASAGCQLRLLSTVLTAEVWSDLAPRVAYVTKQRKAGFIVLPWLSVMYDSSMVENIAADSLLLAFYSRSNVHPWILHG